MNLKSKNILVTGGTGSIGSEIVRQLNKQKVNKIIVFSRDDTKLFYLKKELQSEKVEYVIGDIRDKDALKRVFSKNIDAVIHAAAIKHVSFCEDNPLEAVKTNVLGTQNILDLCFEYKPDYMLNISTDKAANPTSSMGTTKYLAERLVISASRNNLNTKFSSVRFGNVLGSRGSVIPVFLRSIKSGINLEITNEDVTRFAMSISGAVELVIESLMLSSKGGIFVMKMKAFCLGDLLQAFKNIYHEKYNFGVNIIGLQEGEKLHEELITSNEISEVWENDKFFAITNKKSPLMSNFKKATFKNYNSSEVSLYTIKELEKIILLIDK